MTPSLAALQHTTDAISSPLVTHYRTAAVDGVDIFYREAGPADGPAIVLLHGFPTSSHMFRNLIPLLADRYHVIAPDYPGFGLSAAPDRAVFDYGFGRYAHLMDNLLEKLGVQRYAMYVMDYGAPVGYRLGLKHPDRVTGIIVQNGNAYEEGLKAFWDPIKAYWADGSATQCRTETARRAASSPPEAAKRAMAAPAMKGASFGPVTSRLRRCARKHVSCSGDGAADDGARLRLGGRDRDPGLYDLRHPSAPAQRDSPPRGEPGRLDLAFRSPAGAGPRF